MSERPDRPPRPPAAPRRATRWTLRLRLVVAFLVVTLVAVGVIALQVLPTLESSLSQQRLLSLTTDAERAAGEQEAAGRSRRPPTPRQVVETVAARTGGTVTLLVTDDRRPGAMAVRQTTRGTAAPSDAAMRLAARALQVDRARGEIDRRGRLAARVAVPVDLGGASSGRAVLVVSEGLEDVHSTVGLVGRRVLFGGLLALLVALAAGATLAVGISARIRALERGSREVAAGRFTTRFDTAGGDELGELGRSLETMRRQLAELDGSRKRFIATASHELRTPLSTLSGFVELLRDEELDEDERRAFLDRLSAQIGRLTRLADDLLDLSRLESGGLELRPEVCDLHDVAAAVADEFAPVVEREGRILRVRLVGGTVRQRCDPDRVAQVIRILVDNALKHADASAAVEIRVARSGGVARIEVTDHGPGIAAEDVPHLFEPFHGAGDRSGAGLGLAIAHELAHRMRGSLRASTAPGRTTFTLELPA
ncbi:HAMP domain-containing sensor histidine kinase [Patulibacter brassicae]|uniref:histidine kinase n=1 Tax=Patulibacter brassicae TaxID=1705717 RepID=A0ABU4VLT6_9ACTN|nr:HAMP domain-containing sensor histidine kinase [Patulibacter brassicae]MDX8151745.1 HAMP domain-containing sensor histidine kinase [Patulibacter brassicae]